TEAVTDGLLPDDVAAVFLQYAVLEQGAHDRGVSPSVQHITEVFGLERDEIVLVAAVEDAPGIEGVDEPAHLVLVAMKRARQEVFWVEPRRVVEDQYIVVVHDCNSLLVRPDSA